VIEIAAIRRVSDLRSMQFISHTDDFFRYWARSSTQDKTTQRTLRRFQPAPRLVFSRDLYASSSTLLRRTKKNKTKKNLFFFTSVFKVFKPYEARLQ